MPVTVTSAGKVTYHTLQLDVVFEFAFGLQAVSSVSVRHELWAVISGNELFLCQDEFYVQEDFPRKLDRSLCDVENILFCYSLFQHVQLHQADPPDPLHPPLQSGASKRVCFREPVPAISI